MFRIIFGIGPICIYILFGFAIFFLIYNYKKNTALIKKFLSNDEKQVHITQLWNEYHMTFIKDLNRTKTWAEDVFYIEKLYINQASNSVIKKIPLLDICKAVPNTLVGAGILGTFIGLAYGISKFDTSSAKLITDSINILLSGIGTAFGTSICGISLSIIYNLIILKPTLHKMQQQCDVITQKLNNEYFIDEAEYISKLFVGTDDEGNKLYPSLLLRKMGEELEQQSSALSSFSTDLADSIKNMSDQMLDKYNDEIYDMYKNTLQPELEKLNKAIEYLYQEKKESASEVIGQIVKDLQENMKEMISEFKGTISGDTKKELEDLSNILTTAGSSISEMPKLIADNFSELQRNQESQLLYLEEIIKSNAKTLEAFGKELEITNKTIGALNNVYEQINEVSSSLSTVSESMETSTGFLNGSTENINDITARMQEAVSSIDNVIEQFTSLDESLGGVFSQMNSGLKEYKENVQSSLGEYLYKYSSAINEYAEKLAGAADAVKDGVEEFTDILNSRKEMDNLV